MPGLVDVIIEVLQAGYQPVIPQRLKVHLHEGAIRIQGAVAVDVPAVPDGFSVGVEMPVVLLLKGIGREALQPAVIHLPTVEQAVLIPVAPGGFHVEIGQWVGTFDLLLHIDIAAALVLFVGVLQPLVAKAPAGVEIHAVVVIGRVVHAAGGGGAIVMVTLRTRQPVLPAIQVAIEAGEAVVTVSGAVVAALHSGLQGLGAAFLGEEVHHAAERLRAIEHGTGAAHDLYPLHHGRVQAQRCTDLVMVGDLLAVDQDGCTPRLLPANADTTQPRLSGIGDLYTRNVPHQLRQAGRGCARQFGLVDNAQ